MTGIAESFAALALTIALSACQAGPVAFPPPAHVPASAPATASASVARGCPTAATALENVEVFDGDFADLAILKPEEDSAKTSHWPLGYVYDAGRIVNLRCRYRGGAAIEVALPKRVGQCTATNLPERARRVSCR